MNDMPPLEVIDLGEAKALTKGALQQMDVEDHPTLPTRQIS